MCRKENDIGNTQCNTRIESTHKPIALPLVKFSMKKFLLVCFSFFLFHSSFSQTLVSYNLIKSYTTNQIDSILASNAIPVVAFSITYNINIYHVVYNTLDADSLPIIASGALMVPINPQCKVPLMSYQHGTITVKNEVPSTLNDLEVLI